MAEQPEGEVGSEPVKETEVSKPAEGETTEVVETGGEGAAAATGEVTENQAENQSEGPPSEPEKTE